MPESFIPRSLLQTVGLGALCLAIGCGLESPPDELTAETNQSIVGGDDHSPISPPPSNLAVWATSPFDANIRFQCAGHANAYTIMRSIAGGPFSTLSSYGGCQPGATIDKTDTNARPGQHLCYYVTAANDTYAASTATACFDAPNDPTPPAAPSLSIAQIDSTSATLHFVDQSTNETAFYVYLGLAGDEPSYNQAFYQIGPGRSTGGSYDVRWAPLEADTSFVAQVMAYHDNSPLGTRSTITFHTPQIGPTAPTNLQLTATETSVSLSWHPGTRVDHYDIHVTQGVRIDDETVDGAKTTYRYTGLIPTTKFCFKVIAVNSTGSAPSPEACTQTGQNGIYDLPLYSHAAGNNIFQNTFGPVNGATLTSISFPAALNPNPPFNGFVVIPPTSPYADCTNPSKAVTIPYNGTIGATELTKLFGSPTPSLGGGYLLLQGCPILLNNTTSAPYLRLGYYAPAAIAPPTPASSVSLVAGASTDGGLMVQWSGGTGADYYTVTEYSGPSSVAQTWAPGNASQAWISGLLPSSSYCFAIISHNAAGAVFSSTDACGTTSNVAQQ